MAENENFTIKTNYESSKEEKIETRFKHFNFVVKFLKIFIWGIFEVNINRKKETIYSIRFGVHSV